MGSKMCSNCSRGYSLSNYKNYCSEQEITQIKEAKKVLEEYNYVAFRMTPNMIIDLEECERMGEDGIDKDCMGCSCFVCIAQYD